MVASGRSTQASYFPDSALLFDADERRSYPGVQAVARVLVISFTDLASDPRVDRQIGLLRRHHDVVAAGVGPPRHEGVDFVDVRTPARHSAGRALGLARLLTRRYEDVYWKHPTNVEVLRRLEPVRPDVVLANDIESLPVALALGVPVTYDAHEYAPDQRGDRLPWRAVISPYVGWMCRRYIPEVSTMTTVSEGLADAYERGIGVRATIVSNAPPYEDLYPTPVHVPVRILHHGAALRGRGIEQMIEVVDLLGDGYVLDLVLVENERGYRDRLIRRAGNNPRVRFPEPRPMHMLSRLANEHDIGLFLLPPVTHHRRYALPNKLFEFIQGRLAVAIGPSPEMAKIVRKYGCGVVAEDFSPESLAQEIARLDASAIAGFKRAAHAAASELCAEANEELVLQAVEDALAGSARRGRAAGRR